MGIVAGDDDTLIGALLGELNGAVLVFTSLDTLATVLWTDCGEGGGHGAATTGRRWVATAF